MITGATAAPSGVPLPVVKITTWAPPAAMPVTLSPSWPGVSITHSPGPPAPAVAQRPPHGRRPALVDAPQALLLHGGDPTRHVARGWAATPAGPPKSSASRSAFETIWRIPSATAGAGRSPGHQMLRADDLLSLRKDDRAAPATIRSATMPATGLDASPEVASEPPHSTATHKPVRSASTRPCADASACHARAIREPRSMVLASLPRPGSGAPRPCPPASDLLREHRGLHLLASQPHHQRPRHVRVRAGGRQHVPAELEVDAQLVAPVRVGDGHHRAEGVDPDTPQVVGEGGTFPPRSPGGSACSPAPCSTRNLPARGHLREAPTSSALWITVDEKPRGRRQRHVHLAQ